MNPHRPWSVARIERIVDLTPTIRQFDIVPEPPRRAWEPGAHLDVLLSVDGRAQTRSYSLIGESMDQRGYRIAVKRIESGRGGSRAMWSLREGDPLTVSNPIDAFGLRLDAPSYTLIAGGVGITPILGMARRLARLQRPVCMHYAVSTRAEAAFAEELAASLGERFTLHVSDEGARLDLERAISATPVDGECYVCGPIGMLDHARRVWFAQGRAPAALRYETFGASGHAANRAFTAVLPRFRLEVEVGAGQSLLDALDNAGIEVMHDCQRGECGLCAVDVLDSECAIEHRDVFFSDAQKIENKKLCACVSRSAGGRLTIDTGYRGPVAAMTEARATTTT